VRFLLDECVSSRLLRNALTELAGDVLPAREACANALDDQLLAIAWGENRILVTSDKDFGALVFGRRLPHPCIVRLAMMNPATQVLAMRNLIENHSDAMKSGAIIVVTEKRVRIRPADPPLTG